VVDDLHVVYKVQGPAGAAASPAAALKRALTGSAQAGVREVHAVKGVSFAAYEGDAIGLIGTNGSGKSTLLRAIAGLILPAKGAVYTRQQPSLLGVNAVLMNTMPGEWNVMLGLLAMGMRRSEARARVEEIVEFSGINERGDFASLPMTTYSSGMAARLRFAIAAAKSHDILLIDEALATGDARFRKRSAERVQELRAGAGTVVLVSHDAGSIRTSCERTIWLESGVIRADGPTESVLEEYEEFSKQAASEKKPRPAPASTPPANPASARGASASPAPARVAPANPAPPQVAPQGLPPGDVMGQFGRHRAD
jgi:teichoic acid transport system ATP-binding protein